MFSIPCHMRSHIASSTGDVVRGVFSSVQTIVWLRKLGICNERTDVNAYDCIRGLYERRKRVCIEVHAGRKALEVDSGRKIPYRTEESNPYQQSAGPDAQPAELYPRLTSRFKEQVTQCAGQL